MSDERAEVTDYLDRYAGTLAEFDAVAAAELWAVPGMIIDDRFAGVVESRDAMVRGLERSYPLFRQLGLSGVKYELIGHQQLSAAITLVNVHWMFFDANDNQLTDSYDHYILRRDDDGLRALVCIQTDDLEKLRALAAQRSVDLPGE